MMPGTALLFALSLAHACGALSLNVRHDPSEVAGVHIPARPALAGHPPSLVKPLDPRPVEPPKAWDFPLEHAMCGLEEVFRLVAQELHMTILALYLFVMVLMLSCALTVESCLTTRLCRRRSRPPSAAEASRAPWEIARGMTFAPLPCASKAA
mmetsp:Transcript_35111/g.98065  ORF Transcript_35111/g.98065 Transcript_35111/m.98065 type:complete len:153 (-) Transcript_35111:215-673(-)